LPDNIADMCVTSPPYYCLRDYGLEEQIGFENSPDEYINRLVNVFREVKRVIKPNGTLWVVIGDSYAYSIKGTGGGTNKGNSGSFYNQTKINLSGYKPKDLIGIPWMLAFALRSDGWYLRSEIIWLKYNAMPESVTDRPTASHETIFLLSKEPKYYYNYRAIMEPAVNGDPNMPRGSLGALSMNGGRRKQDESGRRYEGFNDRYFNGSVREYRNKRNVWAVNTKPYQGAHFAVFPPDLIRPCILAGSRPNGIVLDPFIGSGTTAVVAIEESRSYIGIEINPKYVELAEERIRQAEYNYQYRLFNE